MVLVFCVADVTEVVVVVVAVMAAVVVVLCGELNIKARI